MASDAATTTAATTTDAATETNPICTVNRQNTFPADEDLMSENPMSENPSESHAIAAPSSSSNTRKRNNHPGFSKLLRLESQSREDQVQHKKIIREARLLYDSLRMNEEEKNYPRSSATNTRACTVSSQQMRRNGEFLHVSQRIIGKIPGISIGDFFFYRAELSSLGVHRLHDSDIDFVSGSKTKTKKGELTATSVIYHGVNSNDKEFGDTIHFTGQGGRSKRGKKCSKNQELIKGNKALHYNVRNKVCVRVIRAFKTISGVDCFMYDGLYAVTKSEFVKELDGDFKVYVFTLKRKEDQDERGFSLMRSTIDLIESPLEEYPWEYVKTDLAQGKEAVTVFVHNAVDEDRDPFENYEYINTTIFPEEDVDVDYPGCKCFEACTEKGCSHPCEKGCSSCVKDCTPCAERNGGLFAYDKHGILFRGRPHIIECGRSCGCPSSCRNRVTQKGMRNRLCLYRMPQNKWIVRSLDLIEAGSFICEYAGVVLLSRQEESSSTYDTLVHPKEFPERWREWGDLSKVDPGYICPDSPNGPSLDYSLDVSQKRNVASYIRHSKTPNVFAQMVSYDQKSHPRVMLFALENIPPMRELTLDYGDGLFGAAANEVTTDEETG